MAWRAWSRGPLSSPWGWEGSVCIADKPQVMLLLQVQARPICGGPVSPSLPRQAATRRNPWHECSIFFFLTKSYILEFKVNLQKQIFLSEQNLPGFYT